jgi:hypothetical protein
MSALVRNCALVYEGETGPGSCSENKGGPGIHMSSSAGWSMELSSDVLKILMSPVDMQSIELFWTESPWVNVLESPAAYVENNTLVYGGKGGSQRYWGKGS